MDYAATTSYRPGPASRIKDAAIRARDWLDDKGKGAWIAAMVLGFIFAWPVGLALLGYMIWSNRMFSCSNHRRGASRRTVQSSGNSAFDAYREETLKRLESEHEEFMAFLARLREARDKAEFDQFMTDRRSAPADSADRPVQL
ncbi:Protein of unknown function [Paracoccus isoporae]|uniref:DUF2852 domain-containing protein n=1 Tax=Paracoccus isoporae TaxID=591205 RepID=A0A1G6SKV2_9RHOB|nr:DUF2852 domain-containing protein [Paracoccus isoporae]SDD16746.1 Protein of unknown function [Paracoccus isoporae]